MYPQGEGTVWGIQDFGYPTEEPGGEPGVYSLGGASNLYDPYEKLVNGQS